MKKLLFLFSFAALLVFGACKNNTEEAVEDTICYEVVEDEAASEDGLELMTDVATLEGEWFMAHCATTRIILFNDGTLVTVNVNGDGMVEGTYYLKNGRITMRDGYGNEIEGLVKADRNGIYLDLQKQVGWFVEADPSDQTDLSALGYDYGYNCSCDCDRAPMDEYRWMEGRWKFTYAGSTTTAARTTAPSNGSTSASAFQATAASDSVSMCNSKPVIIICKRLFERMVACFLHPQKWGTFEAASSKSVAVA